MIIYNYFDIVVAPFPFSDLPYSKTRPAIVISSKKYNQAYGQTILCMITSAANISWHDDIMIKDLKKAGLPGKSFMRPKLGTVDNKLILKAIGELSAQDKKLLQKKFTEILCL